MPERQRKRLLGQRGESEAERFLTARCHYRVVARNYRCPFGEIDMVALDGRTIVFIEVRSHTGPVFGDPLASVDSRKQRQIAKAALHYLSHHRLSDREARFDVVGIRWEKGRAHLTHIKDAFELPRRL
jgi:putative endonuclease